MKHASHKQPQTHHYRRFGIMLVVSFAAMYVLMYAMVDQFMQAIPNINQFYMAGLMTAAMAIIELIVMWFMYGNKKLNMTILAGSFIALALCFFGIRQQWVVGNEEFLKSMIPHHSAAILMCREADLTDPEIMTLCDKIITGQQAEIDWMQAKLDNASNER